MGGLRDVGPGWCALSGLETAFLPGPRALPWAGLGPGLRPADHPAIKSAVPQAWLAAPVIEAMMTTLKKLLGQSLPDVAGKIIEGLLTDEAAR